MNVCFFICELNLSRSCHVNLLRHSNVFALTRWSMFVPFFPLYLDVHCFRFDLINIYIYICFMFCVYVYMEKYLLSYYT